MRLKETTFIHPEFDSLLNHTFGCQPRKIVVMSFPNKAERQKCWDSRDRYWECLDVNKDENEHCLKLRQLYESSCSSQWDPPFSPCCYPTRDQCVVNCHKKTSSLQAAGTLAYRACLKDIDESDWMLFFMPAIEVVVTTENNNDISKSPNEISDSGRPCTLSGLLLCCAEWQAQLLQQDLWQAASSGAPLHGLLTALSLVAAHPTGAEISILNAAEVERLVCLMESVVAHLLSVLASKANNITNFAPSFAEMAEAIDSTFCDILSRDEEEVMDITPAHQLVINCIWFNLKACCNLSSELASIESTASDIAERCGLLIVRVLKQCRHKGVIESAGMSLSNLVKMMTSDKCMHDLPERMLMGFLDLLQEGSSAASVTRKCAGLAILVHKIVASDKQKNRPLLHLCVSRLLKIATDPVRLYSSDTSDLPSTQALHFLCMLVQDSALCQYVAAYMSDITQLCFKKLSSNIWTVRSGMTKSSSRKMSTKPLLRIYDG
uniref:DUF2428 domain-containing protein n=1 Tax=Timema bartmani TaxID=61472 RepID=A0A7R9EPN8_9NEOP|nr:unnamed protein product [Timema bartmani]